MLDRRRLCPRRTGPECASRPVASASSARHRGPSQEESSSWQCSHQSRSRSLHSCTEETPQKRRVVVFHGQFEVTTDPPPLGGHLLAGDGVLGGAVVLLPVQADAPLLPERKVVKVDSLLEQ